MILIQILILKIINYLILIKKNIKISNSVLHILTINNYWIYDINKDNINEKYTQHLIVIKYY